MKWSTAAGNSVDASSPAVANGVVLWVATTGSVGSEDDSIYAYSLGVVASLKRPSPSSLRPNYTLKVTAYVGARGRRTTKNRPRTGTSLFSNASRGQPALRAFEPQVTVTFLLAAALATP